MTLRCAVRMVFGPDIQRAWEHTIVDAGPQRLKARIFLYWQGTISADLSTAAVVRFTRVLDKGREVPEPLPVVAELPHTLAATAGNWRMQRLVINHDLGVFEPHDCLQVEVLYTPVFGLIHTARVAVTCESMNPELPFVRFALPYRENPDA